eukprot:6191397-Pleurochrysis_carterae.AAC.4
MALAAVLARGVSREVEAAAIRIAALVPATRGAGGPAHTRAHARPSVVAERHIDLIGTRSCVADAVCGGKVVIAATQEVEREK